MKKVLVADDSGTARMFTRKCLEIAGLCDSEFIEAEDGAIALEIIKEQEIDLLVTDLNMPNMDGTTLLKHIMASPRLVGMSVIVISSVANPAKIEELLKLGATAVLSKPISPMAIADTLELQDKENDTW